jgi:abortive infection bacteriophage resistance protein
MIFAKPALDIPAQIALLEARGLTVPDHARAAHFLRYISYYRLRAYWMTLEAPAAPGQAHGFVAGSSFEDVLNLYIFDRQLRLLMIDAIERVEVAVRGVWAHQMAKRYGSHGYLDPGLYGNARFFANGMASFEEEFNRSREPFILHYKRKYTVPKLPPVWMAAEILSFGQLSKWIENLRASADRQALARPFGIDERIFCSFLRHLAVVRNICAHHARLWDRALTVKMVLPKYPRGLAASMNPAAPAAIYNSLTMLAHILATVAPGSHWKSELGALLVATPGLNMAAMSFPADWRTRTAWNLP